MLQPSIPEVISDLTDIAVVPSQNLDPASQTGDFVLPTNIHASLDQIADLVMSEIEVPIEHLTDYEMLLYCYPDGRELEVYHPISLSIRFDGAELITCADRVGIVAPSGYLKCERFPKFGASCFPGHQPVHLIGD